MADAKAVFNWYRRHLGFDILVFEDNSTAELMLRYTGGEPRDRYALLSMNMRGGGGLEIWQFKKRKPQPPKEAIKFGDLGINTLRIRTSCIEETYKDLSGITGIRISQIGNNPDRRSFYFSDPWGNWVEMVEEPYVFCNTKKASGGVLGVSLGVSDIERSKAFYKKILGYEKLVSDRTGVFTEFSKIPGGSGNYRRVILCQNRKAIGGFGKLFGPSEIELIQALDRKANRLYENRFWGDLGYIHLCFDIHGMAALRAKCMEAGFPFTVDSSNSFDMGDAAGHFSYIEDPDGTLIELVETHKVPIFKSLGINIDLLKRNPHKPLPKWMVKAMQIHRRKTDL